MLSRIGKPSSSVSRVFCTRSDHSATRLVLTLWRPAAFGDFRKKTPKRTWLCAGISPVRYALQTR